MKRILILFCLLAAFGFAASVEAGETRGVGYWSTHDAEREAVISGAVAFSSVFDTESSLRYYLSLKGKKTLEEHARRQLAAMLLNMAAGLPSTYWLEQGELEIMKLFDPVYGTGATVQDALIEIESAIIDESVNPDPARLEWAKDLADELNNRGEYF